MKIRLDPESGAGIIRFGEGRPYEAICLGPGPVGEGVMLHIDRDGIPLQLEFLSLEELGEFLIPYGMAGFEVPEYADPEHPEDLAPPMAEPMAEESG